MRHVIMGTLFSTGDRREVRTLLCASTLGLGIPCCAFHRFYWSLSMKRQRGGWLGVAHPKTLARPASAVANRFSILGIHRPVLDAGHNDDHASSRDKDGGCRSSPRAISSSYVNNLLIRKGKCKSTTLQY